MLILSLPLRILRLEAPSSLPLVESQPDLLWVHFEKGFPALRWDRKGYDPPESDRFTFNLS